MNHVHISDDIIAEQLADWSSPVGEAVAEIGARLFTTAKSLAPVSKTGGSKYAPSGFLRSRVKAVETHSADGSVLYRVGIPKDARGSRYPLPFIASASGTRRIANQWGRYGSMRADDYFLTHALETTTSLFGPPTRMFS